MSKPLFVKSLSQLLDAVDKIVQLTFLFLLNLIVFFLVLDTLFLVYISHELSVNTSLELLIVIDVLGHPVHSILIKSDIAIVLSNLSPSHLYSCLQVVLLIP